MFSPLRVFHVLCVLPCFFLVFCVLSIVLRFFLCCLCVAALLCLPQIAGLARQSFPCLGHNSWPEAAFSNAPRPGDVSAAISILRWSYPCLGHLSWSEVAFFNAFSLALLGSNSQHCAGATLASDTFVPEVAFPNAFSFVNVSVLIDNSALELTLPRTHCVARGGILQRILI